MTNTLLTLKKVAGTGALLAGVGGLAFGAYVFLMSIPDLKRYMKISMM